MEFTGGKKYGLRLRVPAVSQSKKPVKKPVDLSSVFRVDEEDTTENELARQASKKRSLRQVEDLHKRALEEDPSVFDYDGAYDNMKETQSLPIRQERAQRESKYIGKLVEKAKIRSQEQDIVRERLLVTERMQEDHLYKDKEKFVTSAYKKKLAEQAKWLEEERLRELRDKAEDVTNRSDLSDFYRNLLGKNVAFGAEGREISQKAVAELYTKIQAVSASPAPSPAPSPVTTASGADTGANGTNESMELKVSAEPDASAPAEEATKASAESGLREESSSRKALSSLQQRPNQDMVASARERFLARKRQREN